FTMANYRKVDELKDGESWTEYIERLGHYFIANDIADETKRKAILFTVCGSKPYSLIKSLTSPAGPVNNSFQETVDLVETYCNPKPNKVIACCHFYKHDHQPGESVMTYVTALHQLTEHCEYGNILDDMLRDWMVCGIADDRTQRRLFEEGTNIDFQKAFDIAVSMETAAKNAENLKASLPSPPCMFCSQKAYHVDNFEKEEDGGDTSGTEIMSILSCYPKEKPYLCTLQVEGIDLIMEIDTGASISVVGETTYKRMSRPKFKATKTVLRTYTDEPIKVLGEAQVRVSYQGQAVMAPLYIVSGDGPSLLEIKHVITTLTKSSEIAGQFASVFQEEMGTLRGIKAKIYVDSQVPPMFFKARVMPFALKMRVEGEPERLQEEGVISPVQFSDWAAPIVPVRKPNGDIR
uniref:Peptidase A2 domain-containing protein n=1 Tax=Latimeria chalumnae TaxID=7897 RepID=H2ZYX7_LATCH